MLTSKLLSRCHYPLDSCRTIRNPRPTETVLPPAVGVLAVDKLDVVHGCFTAYDMWPDHLVTEKGYRLLHDITHVKNSTNPTLALASH